MAFPFCSVVSLVDDSVEAARRCLLRICGGLGSGVNCLSWDGNALDSSQLLDSIESLLMRVLSPWVCVSRTPVRSLYLANPMPVFG